MLQNSQNNFPNDLSVPQKASFLTLFLKFCLQYFEKWIKTKVFCSSKHNWEHVFFSEMLWNKISKICFYFCSTERNSELFSLLLNGSERISRVWLYFFSRVRNSEHFSLPRNGSNGIPRVLCSAEQPEFPFGTNHLFRIFRLPRIYFFVGNS